MKFAIAMLGATLAAAVVSDEQLAAVFADVKNDMTIEAMSALLQFNEQSAAVSAGIAQTFQDQFLMFADELPEVCEDGAACRADVSVIYRAMISEQWIIALTSIMTQLENVVLKSENIMKIAYEEAALCAPECPCDYIMTEYIDIMVLQTEITQEITLLEHELEFLTEEQTGILTTCPDYELLQIGGDEYYFYSSTTTITTTTEGGDFDGEWGEWETTSSGGTYEYSESVDGEQVAYETAEWDGTMPEGEYVEEIIVV